MKIIVTLITLFLPVLNFAQQTISASIMHDDIEREYILYIPESYTQGEEVPIVFNFHGYTSNAAEQMFYGDFRPIADTANFIVVHPEGTLFNGDTHWNVGGWTIGSTVDDIGFTNALLDSLAEEYSIDLNRVYSTGMSNGGFMSYQLACQLSERFAAIASVTGSMTPEIWDDCTPRHTTPILEIHGTSDFVIPYNGNIFSHPIPEVLEYWVEYDGCDLDPEIIDIPDINTADGSTVEHYIYSGCDKDIAVEHFKVTGGGHTWPGSAFPGPGTNYDIDASLEIWKFFSRFELSALTTAVAVETDSGELEIFPNPSDYGLVNIKVKRSTQYSIYSSIGKIVKKGNLSEGMNQLNLGDLEADIYIFSTRVGIAKIVVSE